MAPAEHRTHLPAYSRHKIEVLSSAQQALFLPPSTYADLSPDARTRYHVLFSRTYTRNYQLQSTTCSRTKTC